MTKWGTVGTALAVLAACGGAGSSAESGAEVSGDAGSEPVAGAPQVADSYQRSVDEAWTLATAGEYPGNACAALQGRTHGVLRGDDEAAKVEARQAIEACGVTVGAKYYLTYLDKVASGEYTCRDFITESAKIGVMVTSISEDDEAATLARRERLVEAISARVEELCPGVARVL